MSYRPPGWKNPYRFVQDEGEAWAEKAYEEGADAMLEALQDEFLALGIEFKQDGIYYQTRTWEQFPNLNWAKKIREWAHRYGKSKVVFIPEEIE